MKVRVWMTCALTATVALDLVAMPSKTESDKIAPVVRKLMEPEWAALKSGKKTRCEVAEVALKLAGEVDAEAAKLLLMKGAFVLYVKDGQAEKAVETMNAIETTIADLPPQSVTNMIELALLGLSKVDRTRLYRCFEAMKKEAAKSTAPSAKNRTTIQSIIAGMIKVPGRDFWLSATEVTQGQWEAVMGYNLSTHKGANLPVENVSRDDCAVFLEKLNASREVLSTQFEFGLPTLVEWSYAARAGGAGIDCWIKPGVVGNVLDMAWVAENSSNETHIVATKAPNAFGFYDMLGNVWEWMNCEEEKVGCRHGGSFREAATDCTVKKGYHNPRNLRTNGYGFRLAAHLRSEARPEDETYPDNY